MPTPINPVQFPAYIYGLHDIGGQDLMLSAQRPGWLLDTIDLRSQAGADYSSLAEAGLGIIVRLNNGYDTGTIPPSNQYDAFAAKCAAYVKNSPGARIWLIGNETNTNAERPQLPDGSREIITPEKYAQCFSKCHAAIKNVPGHADDWVIPGAVGPYNAQTGDWVQYLVDILNLLGAQADGIALHCYTHDFKANQITDEQLMDPPFHQRHFNFRAYRDFLNALPTQFRALPVFITETNPYAGWRDSNSGWLQNAYKEIDAWNADPTHQPIQALILFRWQTLPDHLAWSIQDKPALIADFRAALAAGYRVRWPSAAPTLRPPATPPQPPPQTRTPDPWSVLFLAHDTPVCVAIGEIVTVNLRVKNVGARVWQQNGNNPVHVGYKWFNAAGQQQLDVEDRRTALPSDVAANQETAFGAILAAPKTSGAYHLRWDFVAEGITWFADAGNTPLVVPVSVTALPRDVSSWRVESNLNPHQVAYALDGDPRTFWDSHAPQAYGQWFRLNLSAPRLIDGIQFLSPGKGFPACYVLRVSADGQTWIEIARGGPKNVYDVMAVFAPLPVQYVQIDSLVASPSSWMISEILIHSATAWKVSASHNASAAAQAIDNRADTAWSSGVPQAPGMWFQIDLGRVETISGLTLIPPSNENPLSFRIAIWNARVSRWQIAYEKLDNHAPVDVVFVATQTQFINIQLLQAGSQVWAIREAGVIREMNTWLGPST
jgi:hypothetical protein